VSDSIVIIVLTMGAFVSTGVDNLLLHIGFMGQDPVSDRQVNLGFLGAYLVILSLGLGVSYAVDLFPSRYIGFLGLVPLTMGVLRLFRAIRGPGQGTAHEPSGMANSWSVGLVMLANNGDSLAVLTSLFAETRQPFTLLIAGTGLAMAFLWTSIAGWVARHPSLARGVRDGSPHVLPLILMFVGCYVRSDTVTDTF
jgi:cadmium resistance protein CadD (predicted permease)